MSSNLESKMLAARARAERRVDYCRKAADASPVDFAAGPIGATQFTRPNLAQHAEQYRAFRDWPFVAVSAIAKKIAGQALHVARNQADGPRTTKAMGDELQPIPGHPLIAAVNTPNPLMTRWALIYSTVASLELTGKAHWWMMDGGRNLQIWPLPSDWVEPKDSFRRSWTVRPFGGIESIDVPGESIALFSLPDPSNPFSSMSPLQSQAKAVDVDEKIQQAQHVAFRNSVNPSVVIKAGRMHDASGGPGRRPTLTPAQRKQLVSQIKLYYSGIVNRDEPFIVDGLIEDIIQFRDKVAELDFANSERGPKSRIMQCFGINPLIVGEIEGANRAQAVVAEQSFCSNVINPLIVLLSEVLTRWVCPLFGMDLTAWFAPCIPNDPEETRMRWNIAATRGAVTINEFRRHLLNLQDVAWGEVPMAAAAPAAAPQPVEEKGLTLPLALDPLADRDPYTLRPIIRNGSFVKGIARN